MDENDVDRLHAELRALALALHEGGNRLTSQCDEAAAQIRHFTRSLGQAAVMTAATTRADLISFTQDAVAAGVQAGVVNLEQAMADCALRLSMTTRALEEKIKALRHLHAASAWKTFLATGLAAAAAIAATGIVGWHAYRNITDVAWFNEVQTARSRGMLRSCPEGGLCVYLHRRWYRLSP